MRTHLLILAVSGLSFEAAVVAEPAKAPVRKADQPAEQPIEVVIASAEQVRTPAADQQASEPAKRKRKARITTCRCGDQTPKD